MNEEKRMKELSKEVKSGFVVIEMMSVVGKMTFRWVSSRQWHWQAESRDHWFVEHVTYDTAPTEPVPGVPLYLNIRRRWPSTSNDRPTHTYFTLFTFHRSSYPTTWPVCYQYLIFSNFFVYQPFKFSQHDCLQDWSSLYFLGHITSFCVPCPFKTWTVMAFHDFLSLSFPPPFLYPFKQPC